MILFDIETRGNQEALQFLPEVQAPGNYKDPEKIEAYIARKREEQINNAALDPDLGKIVAIGWMDVKAKELEPVLVDKIEPVSWLIADYENEEGLIKAFWKLLKEHNGYCVGYNLLNFDLPYLVRRSFALDIKLPIYPIMARYRTQPVLDLMQVLYNWGAPKSLKWVAERYGFIVPMPDVDGSMVADMDEDTLRKYVESDIVVTYQLYKKMEGIYF